VLDGQIIRPDWPVAANVHAISTTRRGGASYGAYDSLNLADHVGDEPHRVQQNRRLLATAQQLPAKPAWLDQQHGCNVACIDEGPPQVAADAAYTHRGAKICAVLTADCLPVLLCDEEGTRVAAVHAGWRGLAAGIIEAALDKLEPEKRRIYAWLGPAIGPQVYEIDNVVRSRLLQADSQADAAFVATREGHWTADIYELARRRLLCAGVKDIFGGDFCTFRDPERFFSYRRQGACGRMASLIWLED